MRRKKKIQLSANERFNLILLILDWRGRGKDIIHSVMTKKSSSRMMIAQHSTAQHKQNYWTNTAEKCFIVFQHEELNTTQKMREIQHVVFCKQLNQT
jgi:hypothetical protein